jgi:hypothetical protein
MAEGNDFKEASVELNRLFFDFENYHQVTGALRALGYDSGFDLAGDNVDRQALLKNIATFGAAALGSSLGSAYYTLQNNDLITDDGQPKWVRLSYFPAQNSWCKLPVFTTARVSGVLGRTELRVFRMGRVFPGTAPPITL